MKLFAKDIDIHTLQVKQVQSAHGQRMNERASTEPSAPLKVDNVRFNVEALGEDADCTQSLPIETHRSGWSGLAVTLAKKLFRKSCQIFINEALARQRRFNGQTTDAYAQLAAEVQQLKSQLKASQEKSPRARKTRKGK